MTGGAATGIRCRDGRARRRGTRATWPHRRTPRGRPVGSR